MLNPTGFGSNHSPLLPPFKALTAFNRSQTSLAQSAERLATGSRINRASDDPAGLITSENLRAVLANLEAESRTLDRADHVANTADGALGVMSDLMVEAEGLAVANANDAGLSDEERAANQMEIDSLVSSANRIARTSTFNGRPLFDGTMTLEAGGTSHTIQDVVIAAPGPDDDAPSMLADARSSLVEQRGALGTFQRHSIQTRRAAVGVEIENTASANSIIRDTDFASEIAYMSRAKLLGATSLKALDLSIGQRTRVLDLFA